jgi:hypothetical protein
MRVHDAGRLETATETVTVSGELASASGNAFEPMEKNIDAVRATQTKLRAMTNQHEYETFRDILADLTVTEIAARLTDAMTDRDAIMVRLANAEKRAVTGVNEALDRQKHIAKLSKETTTKNPTLLDTVTRLTERIDWIDERLDLVAKLHSAVGKTGAGTAVASTVETLDESTVGDESKVREILANTKTALQEVENDQRVEQALELLREAGQEISAAEQERLLEMRRHLKEVRRLLESLRVRDRISVNELLLNAMASVYPALPPKSDGEDEPDGPKEEIDSLIAGLVKSGRYDQPPEEAGGKPGPPLIAVVTDPTLQLGDQESRNKYVEDHWRKHPTLAEFVAADLADSRTTLKTAPRSPELVASLGILLFYERQVFEDAELDLAREIHRHSIRLSKINAGQRVALVNQLARALEVYYQGGIQAEAVAELLMLSSQVGALTFIGTQL